MNDAPESDTHPSPPAGNPGPSPAAEPAADPAYQQAMAHLHRGEWQDAIRGLTVLNARYPDSASIQDALGDAKFRVEFDANNKVTPRRWTFPWKRTLVRATLVLVTLLVLWQVSTMVVRAIVPMMNAAREEQAITALLTGARNYLLAGDWDKAEADYQQVLASRPEQPEAVAGLQQIAEERDLTKMYAEIVAIQEQGDCQAAIERFGQLSVRRSNYKDVDVRVKQCTQRLRIGELLQVAETQHRLGLDESALTYYYQVQGVDADYQRALVEERIKTIELAEALGLLANPPVSVEQLKAAQSHFAAVLKLEPRHPVAADEQSLANAYLDGKAAVSAQDWARAVSLIEPAYDRRPDYLGGMLAAPLYDAYIGLGDAKQQGEGKDCALAYEQYRKAAALPVADKTAANARLEQSAACLTPTPTITPTPLPTEPPPPAATATPTPTPYPLAFFRGKIVFKSDNPEQPGFYAMDVDGGNRQYIGLLEDRSLQQQFAAEIEKHQYSPDGKYSLYVGNVDGRAQVIMRLPFDPKYGQPPDRPVTRMTGIAYDPEWSPDGAWIVFVTNENESDDIWLIRPDGSGQHALMRNDWEWDKHPTWSPDSSRIAFWSNREGTKGIYIMDINGQAVHNISNKPWDEYDPVWIR